MTKLEKMREELVADSDHYLNQSRAITDLALTILGQTKKDERHDENVANLRKIVGRLLEGFSRSQISSVLREKSHMTPGVALSDKWFYKLVDESSDCYIVEYTEEDEENEEE